ncbi:hypothetical protein BJP25_22435 [Actinokineospora bangkokensis]|uniref:Anti-sigma factor antagonist n=1 Tax=Actinokineospora bangkokensis TaxID=1193682 RepID=A0A1Q9LJR6_9PSEU|nr:hypothetical protein BJP25_22435 [Actinokineospora bangkokensis]
MSVHHYRVADVPVLRLSGDIDLATRDTAEAAIAVRQRGPALVLDLAEVDFVGACGITLLVRARRRAEDDGGRFHLACCGPVVRRGLEATGLLGTLRPFDSVAEAVAACSDVPSPRTGK